MKKLFRRIFLAAVLLLALLWLRACHSTDNWDDLRPYWGERPGVASSPLCIQDEHGKVFAHLLREAQPWVEEQTKRFACRPAEQNETDRALLAALGREAEACVVWRSVYSYDIAYYQAVEPTFICFENGDCLFYLYDFYRTRGDLSIPPYCHVLEPLADPK